MDGLPAGEGGWKGRWREAWRQGLNPGVRRRLPALPLVVYMIAGILPVGLIVFDRVSGPAAVAWGGAVLALGLWAFPSWRRWGWLVSVLLIGWTTLLYHAPWRSYRGVLIRPEAFAYAEVEIADPGAGPFRLPGVEADRSLEARIRRMRLGPEQPWQDVRGQVLLRFAEAPELQCGQVLRLQGAFRAPWSSAVPGDFDYRAYLRGKGIEHVAYVDEWELLEAPASLPTQARAMIVAQRDRVVRSLVRGIDDPRDQAVLAAMTMGYRAGLESADRDRYLRSGMIHLFAISGLHVGVLFLLVMWGLLACRVPFTARHLLGPLLVLLYVLLTGMAPSAMRAWLMLTIWSAGRGMQRDVVPVNAVLVAAVVLLLRPFNLFQTGFQYSFVIVIALIVGWAQSRRLMVWLAERHYWRPGRLSGWRGMLQLGGRRVMAACCAMVAAWLGGIGLSAMHNQLFLPAGALINLLAGLLVWPVFIMAILKLAVGALGLDGPMLWLAQSLDWTVSGVTGLADLGAEFGGVQQIPRPSVWLVLAYYAALFLALTRRGPVGRLAWPTVATVATVLLLALGLPSRLDPPAVRCLMPAGEAQPLIVIQPPDRAEAILINTGTPYFGFTLDAWLQTQGLQTLDTVILLDNTRDHAGGLPDLAAKHTIRSLLVMADNERNLADYRAAILPAGGQAHSWTEQPVTYLDWRLEKTEAAGRGDYRVTWHWPQQPAIRYALEIQRRDGYGTQVRLLRDDALIHEKSYAYASDLQIDTLLDDW